MSILQRLREVSIARNAARNRMRTFRLLQSLPDEIRKDIGWPDTDNARRFIDKSDR